jgi:hypothetical protein
MNDMMTPPTETPARPFSARLLDVLRLYGRCPGAVVIEARSMSGISHEILRLDPPMPAFIPERLSDLLLEPRMSLRLAVATRAVDSSPRDLPFALAVWRLASDFDASTGYRRRVRESERQRVREALASFPLPPAFLLDAGPEVAALWPLTAPLSADDPRTDALLTALAERLGADAASARVTATVPIGGPVRNWNSTNPDYVEIIDGTLDARYSLTEIEAALMIPTTTTTPPPTMTATAPPAAERRKGARS